MTDEELDSRLPRRYDPDMVLHSPFHRYVMAVERVERLLKRTSDVLNVAGVDYAVIGGNAVAAWVATVDEAAVRSTKDVDILFRRDDLARITDAMRGIDFMPAEVLGVHMFVDLENPNPKTGVHVVFAGELIRPEYRHPAPEPSQSTMSLSGFRVIDLSALVAMKLQAYRFIDRAHIQDLLNVGLIDDRVRHALPSDLQERLRAVEASAETHGEPPE